MMRIRLKVKEVAQAKGISMGKLSHLAFMSLNTIRSIYQILIEQLILIL